MAIILLIARPFPAALELVRTIAAPMIVMNSFGMLMFVGTFRVVFLEEEQQYTKIIRLTMGIVEQCLSHLRQGLYSVKDMEAVAEIIYRSIPCAAVFIADTKKVLAQKISEEYEGPPDKEQLPRMLLKEIAAASKTAEGDEGAPAPTRLPHRGVLLAEERLSHRRSDTAREEAEPSVSVLLRAGVGACPIVLHPAGALGAGLSEAAA